MYDVQCMRVQRRKNSGAFEGPLAGWLVATPPEGRAASLSGSLLREHIWLAFSAVMMRSLNVFLFERSRG